MEAELKRHLLLLVEAYANAAGMGVTTVWRQVFNDPAFHERLQSDSTITLRTYDRAVGWFDRQWPQPLAWPVDVPRPAAKPEAA